MPCSGKLHHDCCVTVIILQLMLSRGHSAMHCTYRLPSWSYVSCIPGLSAAAAVCWSTNLHLCLSTAIMFACTHPQPASAHKFALAMQGSSVTRLHPSIRHRHRQSESICRKGNAEHMLLSNWVHVTHESSAVSVSGCAVPMSHPWKLFSSHPYGSSQSLLKVSQKVTPSSSLRMLPSTTRLSLDLPQ